MRRIPCRYYASRRWVLLGGYMSNIDADGEVPFHD
jgi:hypothetical protein